MKYGVKQCLGSGECQAVEPGCRLASPGTNTLRSMFPNTKEATTLAFHFWSGEFVYLCEDGTRAGLVTNGVGIPSHPELARREQQLAQGANYINCTMPGNEHRNTPAIFLVDAPKVEHKIDRFEPGPPGKPSRSTTHSRAGGLT